VHLNTYTDVRRRRRCSFVSPDRQSTLGGCALPRPLRCASRRCRAAFGQLLLWRGRGEGRARVPLSSRDRVGQAALTGRGERPGANRGLCIQEGGGRRGGRRAAGTVGARLEQEGWRGDAARASVRWLSATVPVDCVCCHATDWPSAADCSRVQQSAAECSRVRQSVAKCGRLRLSAAECGRVCLPVGERCSALASVPTDSLGVTECGRVRVLTVCATGRPFDSHLHSTTLCCTPSL